MKLISYEEIDEKLDGLYNHPANTEDSAFIREYEAVVDQLARHLETIGSVSIDNDEFGVEIDFSMSKDYKVTRTIVVITTNPSVFSKKLIDTIHEALKKLLEKYRIVLDGAFAHGDSFYVFIDQEEICGWFRSPEKAIVFDD